MSTSTKKSKSLLVEGAKTKDVVVFLLCDRFGKVSVTRGRGTARSWFYINTDHSVPSDVRDLVESHLLREELCSIWWPEMSNQPDACINWGLN